MMRKISFVLVSGLAAACAQPARPAPRPAGMVVLDEGDTASVSGGLGLRFVGVDSDSRCRPGTYCIRAGEARVTLDAWTRGGADPARLRLLTLPPDSAIGTYEDFRIRVDSLTPRPTRAGERYRVWLEVSPRER